MKRYEQYIKDVQSGKRKAGQLEKLAVDRQIRDLKELTKDGFYFDEQEAQLWIDVAELCHHWKGTKAREGAPVILEAWQCFLIAVLMGWKRADGSRRFRNAYIEVARKNGKTTLAAILAIGHMLIDNEPGAQVYGFANKEEQSTILINDIGRIIESSPAFKERFKTFMLRNQIKRVVYHKTSSFAAPLGSDSKTQDGLDPSMAIGDEVHEFKDNTMVDVIESGMGARTQPLLVKITTAGFDRNSYCYNYRRVVTEILEGKKEDPSLFGLIFTLDAGDDWTDPQNWFKANPNLNISVQEAYLLDRLKKAQNEGGTKEVDFKTKNLNVWTDAAEVWIQDSRWMDCVGNIDESELIGRPCFGGLDLAKSDDTNALVLIFPMDGDRYAVKCWFWMPKAKIKPGSNLDTYSYIKWVEDGYMRTTGEDYSDDVVNYGEIAEDIRTICGDYDVKAIGFDPWRFYGTIGQLMEGDAIEFGSVAQTMKNMSEPTKKIYEMVMRKELIHFNNPVLRWMCGNVTIMQDTKENIMMNKSKSNGRIDGMAALANAVFVMDNHEDNSSAYNDGNDLIFI